MSTDRDMTRIVRSWLRTDEHESADRVLDIVIARLDATPQRRSPWPARRIADMNFVAKLATAAAAVVVVAIVGYNLLPASSGVGGGPAVSPSASPSPTSRPTPSPTPRAFPAAGDLSIGRHSLTEEGVTFTLELTTAGWVSEGSFGIDRGHQASPDAAAFIFWTTAPVGVYADPCAQTEAPPVAQSAAELADALTKIPGTELVSGPSDVTVDGRPAKHVVIRIPEQIDCTPSSFYLWYTDVSCGGDGGCGRYATEVDSTINVWIINVDGAIVWIDGETYQESSAQTAQEVRQIVDSIRFE
jgi:hypothetical protein